MDYRTSYNRALEKVQELPDGLYQHCLRVSDISRKLAGRFGGEPEAAALAGLLHDLARGTSPAELIRLAQDWGIPVNGVERSQPALLHGPVAAELARRELCLEDAAILSAVRWHSTGRGEMGLLDKVVFLADKLDPGKEGYYPPGLEGLAETAHRSLDEALLLYYDWQLALLLQRSVLIHPATVEARNTVLQCLRNASV